MVFSGLPLVSVIITLYNYEQYIQECLVSVLGQNYPSMEIIVVDDGSTDNGPNVAAAVLGGGSPTGTVFMTGQNKGYAHAKNVGIQRATGRYLAFIDADDVLLPDSIQVRAEYLAENPKCDFVHGQAMRWYGEQDIRGYNAKTYCHAQGRMYKRSLHADYGLYYEPLAAKADKEWIYRLGIHPESPMEKKIREKKLDVPVALYRKHDLAMHKQRKQNPKYNEKIEKVFKQRMKELRKNGITRGNTEYLAK